MTGQAPATPGRAAPSLGEVARQISDYEHPAAPGTGQAE
jgi:hypothetical protein